MNAIVTPNLSPFKRVTNDIMGTLKQFLAPRRVCVFDLENDNLLFGLTEGYCAVATDYHTGLTTTFAPDDYIGIIAHIKQYDVVCGHNIIGYDLPALLKLHGARFRVLPDTFEGKEIYFLDTLVMSKLLNPDRQGGHGLESWGQRLGSHKIDFHDFSKFTPAMLTYCKQDVALNVKVLNELVEEWGDYDWWDSYELEKAVWDIITRQEQYGFTFDQIKAGVALDRLDELLAESAKIVLPLLPPRPLAATNLKKFMPPAKPFKQSKKHPSGVEPSANAIKKFGEENVWFDEEASKWLVRYPDGEIMMMKDAKRPLQTHEPMPMSDTGGMKEHIMSKFGWIPTGWKEKELTTDDKTKQKLSKEKFLVRVHRYCDECLTKYPTLGTHRVAAMKAKGVEDMRAKMLNHDMKRPLKVITQPLFNEGQDKDKLCPALERLGEKVEFVRDIIHWLTYRHRRNFILSTTGNTGLLANPRLEIDGRLPTPADTLGCNTGRFKHKIVANVPRVTSIFGKPLRELFCASEGMLMMGCDADALEARIEGHYCFKYEGGETYAWQQTAAKPNDTHTVRAKNLGIVRNDAKKLKYSITYGAQFRKLMGDFGWEADYAKGIFNAFWEDAAPLKMLKMNLVKHWNGNGKKWIRGIDGRKLSTRSEHSILNTLFQSAGVISMKRAMVFWDRWVSNEGLTVKQLIAYHDEAQMEDLKANFQYKTFATEEEAEAFKEEQMPVRWSDVKPTANGGFYTGYNRGGELCELSILEAGKYYELNVDLTSGYMIGRNWADCH